MKDRKSVGLKLRLPPYSEINSCPNKALFRGSDDAFALDRILIEFWLEFHVISSNRGSVIGTRNQVKFPAESQPLSDSRC